MIDTFVSNVAGTLDRQSRKWNDSPVGVALAPCSLRMMVIRFLTAKAWLPLPFTWGMVPYKDWSRINARAV